MLFSQDIQFRLVLISDHQSTDKTHTFTILPPVRFPSLLLQNVPSFLSIPYSASLLALLPCLPTLVSDGFCLGPHPRPPHPRESPVFISQCPISVSACVNSVGFYPAQVNKIKIRVLIETQPFSWNQYVFGLIILLWLLLELFIHFGINGICCTCTFL